MRRELTYSCQVVCANALYNLVPITIQLSKCTPIIFRFTNKKHASKARVISLYTHQIVEKSLVLSPF